MSATIKPVAAVPAASVHRPPDGIKLSFDPTIKPWTAEDGVIEEFAFDDELTRAFRRDMDQARAATCTLDSNADCAWVWAVPGMCSIAILTAPCAIPAYLLADVNAAEFAYSRFLAVSRENIYIVRRKHKTCFRCDCCDIAETRKTIPINNVQDIMVAEPAAFAWCTCCIPNVLNSVHIETAGSSGGDPIQTPSQGFLVGLADPQRFRSVVLNLKKGLYVAPSGGETRHAVQQLDSLGRALGALGGGTAQASSSMMMPPSAATAMAGDGSKTEALLGEMLSVLRSIDHSLRGGRGTEA